METTYQLKGQPVTIVGRENRSEVWVETADNRVLRVFKAGLSTGPIGHATRLSVDSSRGTDGAR